MILIYKKEMKNEMKINLTIKNKTLDIVKPFNNLEIEILKKDSLTEIIVKDFNTLFYGVNLLEAYKDMKDYLENVLFLHEMGVGISGTERLLNWLKEGKNV